MASVYRRSYLILLAFILPSLPSFGKRVRHYVDRIADQELKSIHPYLLAGEVPDPDEVVLSIYDVHESCSSANDWGKPIGFGAWHIGVVLYDQEWGFGAHDIEGQTGITPCRPRRHMGQHVYRFSWKCGKTKKSAEEVAEIIERLGREWTGPSYDLLDRNCGHFAHDFLAELDVRSPRWITRLANTASGILWVLSKVAGGAREVARLASLASASSMTMLESMSSAEDPFQVGNLVTIHDGEGVEIMSMDDRDDIWADVAALGNPSEGVVLEGPGAHGDFYQVGLLPEERRGQGGGGTRYCIVLKVPRGSLVAHPFSSACNGEGL